MALQGHLVEIKAQSSGVAMTDEATTGVGDLVYQIDNTAKRYIDLNTAVVVKDSAVVTTENYKVDYLNGKVTFATAVARVITISGAYMVPTTIATADSFSNAMTADMLENTPFNSTFRTFQSGLITGSLSLGRFHVSDSLFVDDLLNGDYKIVEINVDPSNSISVYGLLGTDSIESPVDGLIKESLTYQTTNNISIA
jgi:hypothetical protein